MFVPMAQLALSRYWFMQKRERGERNIADDIFIYIYL